MLDDMFKLTLDKIYYPSDDFYRGANFQNPILSAASTITRSKRDQMSKRRGSSNP